ncbi:MAG: hypothetical protein JXQ97_01650 [Natronospirillum sp.]
MKSSSDLFPVTLLTAELKDDWNEDTYLLKPNNSGDTTVEFALTRFSADHARLGIPVLWLPPFLQGRSEWLSRSEERLRAVLAAGYDVWFLEWRGHGASVVNDNWASNSLDVIACCDLPAALDFVQEQTKQTALLVSESSAAQVWARAHGMERTMPLVGSVLLWPTLGKISCAEYATQMGWLGHELEVTRSGVKRLDGHESINRPLFDELLLGQRKILGEWRYTHLPKPFYVADRARAQKTTVRWLSKVPGENYVAVQAEETELQPEHLLEWLRRLCLTVKDA